MVDGYAKNLVGDTARHQYAVQQRRTWSNPYKSFLTSLDKGRMQQVITNFTTNAVKYTHQGHIKVGYRYISFEELKQTVDDPKIQEQAMPFSGIYMYCEDTDAGIPKDKQR